MDPAKAQSSVSAAGWLAPSVPISPWLPAQPVWPLPQLSSLHASEHTGLLAAVADLPCPGRAADLARAVWQDPSGLGAVWSQGV